MEKYTVKLDIYLVENMIKGLRKFRKQMIAKRFVGRYLEYPFLKLNENTEISLKYDKYAEWEKKNEQEKAKVFIKAQQENQ